MHSSALLAVVALATGQWIQPRIFDQPNLRSGNARELATYLEFAPASGAGLPVAENLCDALAAEVPNWSTPVDGGAGNWCLGGDGQEVTGSQVDFEPFGSPTPVSVTVCPSGPDCTTKSALGFDGSTYLKQAGTPAEQGPGDFTSCVLHANAGAASASGGLAGKGEAWGFRNYFGRVMKTGGTVYSDVYSTEPPIGSMAFICLSYRDVSDGASHLRHWVNGSNTGSNTAAVSPVSSTAAAAVAYREDLFGVGLVGNGFGAFYVDQELSAAQIAAIARRVLADSPKALIRGSPSLALTYTRTGSMFCSKADNTGSILPANRPCISQNGILVEAAATNLVLRSQELDNAAWRIYGGNGGASSATYEPVVTANYGLAPDGTKTAERIQFKSVPVSTTDSIVYQSGVCPASGTASVYVRATTSTPDGGTGSIDLIANGSCTPCAVLPDGGWSHCTAGAGAAGSFGVANTSYALCGGGARPEMDLLVWGAQCETGSVATSYIPTTSAAATRGATQAYLTHGQSTYSTGCIAGTRASSVAMDQYANNGFISTEDGTGGSFQQAILSSSGLKGYVGQAAKATGTLPSVAGTDRLILRWDGSGTTLDTNGTLTTGAAGTPAATTILRIGNYGGGATEVWPGRYSAVQLDTRFSRCR